MKRWRWWIVPLILSILFAIFPWLTLVISFWPQLFQMPIAFTVFGLVFYSGIGNVGVVVWPYSLVLVWPAALTIHGVWKRRKAKWQGALEVQPSPKDAP